MPDDVEEAALELSEAENERLWLAEAERRQREIESGRVDALPGEEVLRRVAAEIS